MKRMTLEEKVAQMQNKLIWDLSKADETFQGKSWGCTHDMQSTAKACAEKYKALQDYMRHNTRLGIPILTACEGFQD